MTGFLGTFLIDFDGTVALNDVGNDFFDMATQGKWREPVEAWKAGRISGRECLITECSLARATREMVLELAQHQPIDSEFKQFLLWVESLPWQARIVSDGLELYIRDILTREGLERLPIEANQVVFSGDLVLPSFPYAGRGCGSCGNCKQGAVEEARAFGPVWFIGDGMSDRCGAQAADKVFAKRGKALAEFCGKQSIEHREFDDFGELLRLAQNEFRTSAAGCPS